MCQSGLAYDWHGAWGAQGLKKLGSSPIAEAEKEGSGREMVKLARCE